MVLGQQRTPEQRVAAPRPAWHAVLRAVREAAGVTQEGWAAQLGLGRRTIQRWERGETAPDASGEAALQALCAAKGLFRHYASGTLAGLSLTPELLQTLLAEARQTRTGAVLLPLPSIQHEPPSLPLPLTSLVGREEELADAVALLGSSRLLTLTGPGGIGKTRLALALAERVLADFPDGAVFVDLSAIVDAGLVAATVAQALGIRESGGQPLVERLTAFLRHRRLLLVLDNFEQLVEAAGLVHSLLLSAPALRVLVTSRVVLQLAGEQAYAVSPLPVPDDAEALPVSRLEEYPAVALFVQRAQNVQPDFDLTAENGSIVAAICGRLDGLPLALELAAARIRVLTPAALLARLDNRLGLLTSGGRGRPERQQTLRATIQWSYDLLEPVEQLLFRRLAVFAGGFTLPSAEAVCNCGDLDLELIDGVSRLVEKSLLQRTNGSGGEPRYTLLATIRDFALEQLVASYEAGTLWRRHAQYFLTVAQESAPLLFSGAEARLQRERLDAEHDNLRAALGWSASEAGDGALAAELVLSLRTFWEARGHFAEGRTWVDAVLARPGLRASARLRGELLSVAARLANRQNDFAASRSGFAEALALFREAGDIRLLAGAHLGLGLAEGDLGNYAAERAHAQEALELYRELDDQQGIAAALLRLGVGTMRAGDLTTARPLIEECLAAWRVLGGSMNLGFSLVQLASLALRERNDAAALPLLEEGLAAWRAIDYQYGMVGALRELGGIARRRQAYAEAAAYYEESLSLSRTLGNPEWQSVLLANLGWVALQCDEPERAAACFRQGIIVGQDAGTRWPAASCIAGLAAGAAARGQPEAATRLFGAAAAQTEGANLPLSLTDRSEWEEPIAALRSRLGNEAFAAAWSSGRDLIREDALRLALEQCSSADAR